MKKILLVLTGLVAALLLAAPAASAKPIAPGDGVLTQSASVNDDCTVDITFTNTTKWLFVTGVNVVGGEQLDKITVDGRDATAEDTVTQTYGPFDTDTTLSYGTVEGAEADWYLPFQTVVVPVCVPDPAPGDSCDLDGQAGTLNDELVCVVPTTTTPPPSSSTTPPPANEDTTTTSRPAVVPAGTDEEREMLAATGTGGSVLPWLIIAGVLLLGGGGAAMYLSRRRNGEHQ